MTFAMFVLGAALNPGGLIAWIVIGLVAGWLAGVIMPGRGFGLLGDLVVGLIGAFVGGLIVNLVSPNTSFGFWSSWGRRVRVQQLLGPQFRPQRRRDRCCSSFRLASNSATSRGPG
jgi:uncharacterized membrane protein YeaQ/YmgE (transglycosylase-associated protein family)